MELRLQKFVSSMGVLADIRNLDPLNPTIFQLEHPLTATLYVTVSSITEPSHLGLPINATWVVLDPASPYYQKALKLKGSATDTIPVEFTPLDGLQQKWIEIFTYDEIFADPQYYDMPGGAPGPKGDPGDPGPQGLTGPKGDTGETAVIDMPALAAAVAALLAGPTPELRITGQAVVPEGTSAQYTVSLVANGQSTPVAVQIELPAGTVGATISSSNLLTVSGLAADANITLTANYTYGSTPLVATLPITLSNAVMVSIAISGVPATIVEARTFQAVATATYNGAANRVITPVWTVTPSSAGTITSGGIFTAASVSADTTFTLKADYSEAGVSATHSVQSKVINVVPTVVTVTGPASVFESLTAQFAASVVRNDGTSGAITPVWSVAPSSAGTINSSGLFTAALVTADVVATVTGAYTQGGATVEGTKNITVKNLVPVSLLAAGATSVFEGASSAFIATVTNNDASTALVTPTWEVIPTSAGTITTGGVFTAAAQTADVATTLRATYTFSGVTVADDHLLTVKNVVPVSLAVTGPANTVSESGTLQLTATVTRNDGTTSPVTATWTRNPTTAGSVDAAGLFTAVAVASNTPVAVTASYTNSGVTVTGVFNLTVTDVPVTLQPYFGAAATNSTKDQALILGLAQRGPTSDRLNPSMTIIDGPGLSMFYAYPVSYGLATFVDLSNGFEGGWDGAGGAGDGMTLGPITVTVNGVPFYLYKTDQANISPASNPTNWRVS